MTATTPERVYNVLFICTGNSARSILAEGLLNKLGEGRFKAWSAGSHPKGTVHPLALETLEQLYIQPQGYSSKSWDVFAQPDAPALDFVFTVCDNAAGEVCPIWPGHPQTAHWGIEDPAAVEGSTLERKQAFATAYRHLKNRITAFVALPFERLDRQSLASQLDEIGRQDGATRAGDSQP
jgi:arsenate reductase (thioredoxin)